MNLNKFKDEVSKLECIAKKNSSKYKFKVFCMSILGYLYIFSVIIILLGLVSGIIGFIAYRGRGPGVFLKLLIPIILLIWVGIRSVLSSLVIRIPKPQGIFLTPDMVPSLFNIVAELSDKMKCPKIKNIILNDDYNAAVLQRPRLGTFGLYENYLIIGLPYMMALSINQFKAVIAHELGHISGSHGRFSGWIYRVRSTWYNIAEAMEEKDYKGSFLFNKFFEWYIPKLWAYTFVLARANEYEADKYSATMTDSKTAASSLVAATIYNMVLDTKFWKDIYSRVNIDPEPPAGVFWEVRNYLKSDIEDVEANKMLESALKVETGYDDTHPSLNDRLLALGVGAFVPQRTNETAAENIFGNSLEKYECMLSDRWKENFTPVWEERHEYICNAKKQLAELEDKSKEADLTADEAYSRASIIEMLQGSDAALPIYQSILKENLDHLEAEYAIGRILIEQSLPEGIEIIEEVIKKDKDYAYNGYELIYNYFEREGKETEAEVYAQKLYEQQTLLEEARKERDTIRFGHVLLPHELDKEEIEKIRSQLANYKQISEVYIVRKQLKHFQSEPLYVLGISTRNFWLKENYNFSKVVANEIEVPGECFVIVIKGDNLALGKEMKKIQGSRIL